MASEFFHTKTLEQIIEEFEIMCHIKSTAELKTMLQKSHMLPSENNEVERKIEIMQRILAARSDK